jgi:hypothetical protein
MDATKAMGIVRLTQRASPIGESRISPTWPLAHRSTRSRRR